MENSIKIMKDAIVDILGKNISSIYIYGSVTTNDFKLGWSDIDILCLTNESISDNQASRLVNLRQDLLNDYEDNEYFRLFEGGMLSVNAFVNTLNDNVVYWGSSGQRITNRHHFNSFSLYELMKHGILIYGTDIRDRLKIPTFDELRKEVIRHYETIRKYAVKTDRSIYSVGWLLDIARGIYTLRTGRVISKTDAGEWALENNISPSLDIMKKVIEIRKHPKNYIYEKSFGDWAESIGDEVQKFADVLENEISILNK